MKVKGKVIKLWTINKGKDGRRRVGDYPDDFIIPIHTEPNLNQWAEIETEEINGKRND